MKSFKEIRLHMQEVLKRPLTEKQLSELKETFSEIEKLYNVVLENQKNFGQQFVCCCDVPGCDICGNGVL